MYLIALPWVVLQLTGSALAVGSTFALAALPRALFLPIGGVWADKQDPRRIMILVSLTRCVVLLGVFVLLQQGKLWAVYPAAIMLGTAAAFYYPAESSILPRILPKQMLQFANGLVQGSTQLVGVVGPAVGGVAVGVLGSQSVLALAALAYVSAALLLVPIRVPLLAQGNEQKSFWRELLAGARCAWADPVLRGLLLTIAFVNLGFVGPFNVGLPALAQGPLQGGAEAFGLLAAAFSVGALLGVGIATFSSKLHWKGGLAIGSVVLTSLGLGSLAGVSDVPSALGLLVIAGVGSGLVNVLLITLLQIRAPEAFLGRIMSLVLVSSFGLAPISQFLAGVIAQEVGVRALFVIGACISLSALTLGGRWIMRV